jgi:uncharacterized protein YceH (UPF0502 family)
VEAATPAPEATFPLLDAVEARILGSLVEKAAITPETYPLTENAIVAACNQKTSREPLMQLETGAVAHALRAMQGRGLVREAPSSQRALRYEHRFDENYGTTARQRAVLCVLLLRGAQTIAELLSRTERINAFPGSEDVRDTLDRLAQREAPLVTCIGRAPGQREDRYVHLLCGPVDPTTVAPMRQSPEPASRSPGVHERLDQLEREVAELRAELAALKGEG